MKLPPLVNHPQRSKLNSLQVLRAVAAILVAYAHSIDLSEGYSPSFQNSFFHLGNFGAFGVDIFFIISGFVISYSADRYIGIRDGGRFLLHRFKRINPAYYIASLILLIHRIYFWNILHRPPEMYTSAELLKSAIILPLTDHTRWEQTILPITWTLSFEWLFYILFFLTIAARIKRKLVMLWGIALILIFLGILSGNHGDMRLRFITNPMLLEFISGTVLYWCYINAGLKKQYAWCLLSVGIAICIAEIIFGYGSVSEAYVTISGGLAIKRVFRWGIPAALIVSGVVFLEKNNVPAFSQPKKGLLLLGAASYSLYLTQELTFQAWRHLYNHVGFFLPADLAIGLQLLLAIGVGLLFYFTIERSLLRIYSKPASRSI